MSGDLVLVWDLVGIVAVVQSCFLALAMLGQSPSGGSLEERLAEPGVWEAWVVKGMAVYGLVWLLWTFE